MWFSKTSVVRKVTNHKVVEIQRNWNISVDGKRFQAASYLYAVSNVCTFCSQFFDPYEEVKKVLK